MSAKYRVNLTRQSSSTVQSQPPINPMRNLEMFSPLQPGKYTWAEKSESSSIWQRPTLAGENQWLHRLEEYHQMFLSGSITLKTPTGLPAFEAAATDAWVRLLYSIPDIAVSGRCQDDGQGYLQFHVPRDYADANEWARRTLVLKYGPSGLGFHELREKVLSCRGNQLSDRVFVLLHCVADDENGETKCVDFILNVGHQITDGIGIRILLDKYFHLLAETLGSPRSRRDAIKWQDCMKNLSRPWISLGEDYQSTLSGPF